MPLQQELQPVRKGHRTSRYPREAPSLPGRFRGPPLIDVAKCLQGCRACAHACPTEAITLEAGTARVDLGRCLFCTDCAEACPQGAVSFSSDYRLAEIKMG